MNKSIIYGRSVEGDFLPIGQQNFLRAGTHRQ